MCWVGGSDAASLTQGRLSPSSLLFNCVCLHRCIPVLPPTLQMASIDDITLINTPAAEAAAEAEEEAFVDAMLLTSGCALPMVVKAVIQLNALDIIAGSGPGAQVSAAEVAAQLPTRNPDAAAMLDRMLRLLAAYSLLTCSLRALPDGGAERLYGLAAVSKYLTSTTDGVFVAPFFLLHQHKAMMESWHHLKDAVLEGGSPFKRAHGMTIFEYQGMDPKFSEVFNGAMSTSSFHMDSILKIYNGFEGLTTLVDVGGGVGAVSGMIVSKHPQIRAINFDLPHVIKKAHSYPGVDHVSGDMFVDIPKGDAVLLKWICHDWDDEQCLKLLRNCYEAVPWNGKVIVMECLVGETPDPSRTSKFATHLDLIMLAQFSGKERTKREFEALAKGAHFACIRVVGLVYNMWIMEFYKKIE